MLDATMTGLISGVAVAIIGGIATYLVQKTKTRVDVQKTLNEGFGSLISELQEERLTLSKTNSDLHDTIRDQDRKIRVLESRVLRLVRVATAFHNYIVTQGLTPPAFDENDLRSDPS